MYGDILQDDVIQSNEINKLNKAAEGNSIEPSNFHNVKSKQWNLIFRFKVRIDKTISFIKTIITVVRVIYNVDLHCVCIPHSAKLWNRSSNYETETGKSGKGHDAPRDTTIINSRRWIGYQTTSIIYPHLEAFQMWRYYPILKSPAQMTCKIVFGDQI